MNQITAIHPYKVRGTWVFDDETVGLKQEPFVSGMPEMIDDLVRFMPKAEQGFRLLFSLAEFPGYHRKIEWVKEEFGGNWYFDSMSGLTGWLCPALFKYFDKAPAAIYVKAERL